VTDDLPPVVQIEHAASKILVEGATYPEILERMSGRRGCWSVPEGHERPGCQGGDNAGRRKEVLHADPLVPSHPG